MSRNQDWNPDWGEEVYTMELEPLAVTDRAIGFKNPDGGSELLWLPKSALFNVSDIEERKELFPEGMSPINVEMKAWLAVKEGWADKDDFF